MPLTPEEIERKEFMIELRGYDRSQVHTFLRQVAAEYRNALENARAPGESLDEFGARLARVLRAANDEAADIVASAKDEAARILAEARREATPAPAPNDRAADPKVRSGPQGILGQFTRPVSEWTRRGRS